MSAVAEWNLPRTALADPHGPSWDRWTAALDAASGPWTLDEASLGATARVAFATGWVDPAGLDGPLRRRLSEALGHAAALAARLRLHETLAWLASRPGVALSNLEAATLAAVARLDPDALPAGAADHDLLARPLEVLALMRRYGPDEPDVQRRAARAVGLGTSAAPGSVASWLDGQLHLAAAWATLCGGATRAAASLVGRSPVASESWVGWLAVANAAEGAVGRAATARALYRAAAASHRTTAPLRPEGEADAVAWWRAETAGWQLALAGAAEPEALTACPPGVLTGSGEVAGWCRPTGVAGS